MIAVLTRYYHPDATLGELIIGSKTLVTVERPWAENKPNISCIPEGLYNVERVKSPKFGDVWEVKDVTGRTHILFHSANRAKELQGCIAPGLTLNGLAVQGSRDAMRVIDEQCSGINSFKLHITQFKPLMVSL